jgi:peptidyl-prolyl cis-trans isomerase SurA
MMYPVHARARKVVVGLFSFSERLSEKSNNFSGVRGSLSERLSEKSNNFSGVRSIHRHPGWSLVCHALFLALALCFALVPGAKVRAQALVLSVNNYPITDYDVGQRIRLLKVLKQPAGREQAIEDLIEDRIKLQEMAKYQITATDQDIITQGARDAMRAKIAPAAFGQALQAAKIDEQHWKEHFKARHVWNVYVAALNKTVEISEEEVRAELAKRGKTSEVREYVLRQVVLVIPSGADASRADVRMKEAQGLRTRFTDCASGAALLAQFPEVVIKEPVRRSMNSLPDGLRDMFDRTPTGRLTAPERTPLGIEMVAICQKNNIRDESSAGADIRNELLTQRLEGASTRLFKDMRARAIIVRS